MKVYLSATPAPNPHALEIILALKGMEVETVKIDLMGGENRGEEYKKRNPAGQLPCLETDSGQIIAEVAAIAEYLDELKPDPTLSGHTAEERAETRMKMRQMDYWIIAPTFNGFRHSMGKEFFAGRMQIYEDLAAPSKKMAQEGLGWLDKQMAGKTYICGERLTYADVLFFTTMEFAARVKQGIDPAHSNLTAYMERLRAHDIIGAS